MKFYLFHLMPYPYLDPEFDRYAAAWITYPNRNYDPQQGTRLYNEYLDQMEYAEELGFDGICVNEHHQTTYGTMPAPNIMAAALARRTSRVQICILGNAISLHQFPQRVAEEVAMLDVITGGRIVSGFVRGIGAEYYSSGANPTESRDRFYEAHDLIIRAWTEPGPFEFYGRYYQFRYVNPWPRPLQTPHPPVWIPSTGSTETIDWAARLRYPFLMIYAPLAVVGGFFEEYRKRAEAHGEPATPDRLGWSVPIYVAATDARAHEEAREHMLWLFNKGLKFPAHVAMPPGYLTEESWWRTVNRQDRMTKRFGNLTYEDLVGMGYVLVGSPDTVAQTLVERRRALGCGKTIGLFQVGDMPHKKAVANMELFAREVMPRVREATAALADPR
jgi:alkanesulfonate monooxygenase SsuD/methylene tetrahydromethanopterin reductase-like flavin-dependent oxidoreductase (luciferase family)